MARKRSDNPEPQLKQAYRVARNSCFHGRVEYKVGDLLPPLPLAMLNVHLPNLELVEVEDDAPEPTEAVEIIDQVEADGGVDYVV